MKKNLIDMDYDELGNLLDLLLEAEGLPKSVEYSDNKINYRRRGKFWIIMKALYRLIKAEVFYMAYMRKRLISLKKQG